MRRLSEVPMPSPNIFQLVSNPPDDAVTVLLMKVGEQTLAEASWPFQVVSGGRLEGPALGNPIDPPRAFNNAIEAMARYGLNRIVVILEDGAEWNPAWGKLISEV